MDRRLTLSVSLALAGISVAAAHPHVFIEMTSAVVFNEEGNIKALKVEWLFDADYSAFATQDLDGNKDGVLTPAELNPLAKANIESLKEWSYFVYGRVNGEKIKWADVSEYGQSMTKDGRLKMYFVVPFATPVDPRVAKFLYRIYDPTFYIAIDFAGGHPVKAVGNKPQTCRIEVGPLPDPRATADTKTMLAGKGTDWTPDGGVDFGIMFAQPVSVHCGGAK
jgi:ABC-type uncharacterized transport system substrate-binding protein